MTIDDIYKFIQVTATILAVAGGLIAIVKYFSERREKELREWQKVVIYKILRRTEMESVKFTELLKSYRSEAQAFRDIDLSKKEISEDSLRRVLVELTSSGVVKMDPMDSFKLNIAQEKPDPTELLKKVNDELVRLVGQNPYAYTIDVFAKDVAQKVGLEIPILKNELRKSINIGLLVIDDEGRLAFPT